jgi:hypothetical protein
MAQCGGMIHSRRSVPLAALHLLLLAMGMRSTALTKEGTWVILTVRCQAVYQLLDTITYYLTTK